MMTRRLRNGEVSGQGGTLHTTTVRGDYNEVSGNSIQIRFQENQVQLLRINPQRSAHQMLI
ncbi:hypothetical protein WUBG_13077 [Wuchereria bancrofti]|uniref:Uncharacterized protein n=2 Tax=Wuchereria bancrofti TaxID=6293 RepID=J9E1J5_WUCBA|nr:hypothetical protein WUBG_13077 [Wuchereria bancrofti]